MQQLLALWQALTPRRRMIVVGATAFMFAAVLSLAGMASRPSMALLYAGLEGAQAGEVITALDAQGVAHEIRGDAIYVEAARRDELRMMLASEGVPSAGGAGYELLDGLSGFATTSQMFDAAYWRAKEGELARTIVSSSYIQAARVHIAVPSGSSLRREGKPTASVTVTTEAGGLSAPQAKALKFLVASAVTGMSPEDVAVIDGAGGLVGETPESGLAADDDRASALKRSVERLLEARVGYGKAVVEVALETVTDKEAITERVFDPESRVAISTDTEEKASTAKDQKPGAVTVASNLPAGDAAAGGQSSTENSETRERVNFEVSETTRELIRSPGAVKRLTVAVLVDGVTVSDEAGVATWQPRGEEELATLRELVASAVGFDEARGDVITVKSMEFEPVTQGTVAQDPSLWSGLGADPMTLVQLGVLALVALVLGLFVLRPVLTRPVPRPDLALPPPRELAGPVLTGEIDDGGFAGSLPSLGGLGGDTLPMMATPDFGIESAEATDAVSRLRRLIGERRPETVEVLRSWADSEAEKA